MTQSSLTLNVTVTAAMPLSVTTSVIFSNIDPVSHMGTTATLVAYLTGGTGPFTYQWSGGGGGTWSGNRMTMTQAPSTAITGTLTVTGNGQTVPVVATIPVSPVVTEDELYAGVLDRIWAVETFANNLDSLPTGGAYFHNMILSKANLQQPILTPQQYASLVTIANNYKADQANDVKRLGKGEITRATLNANQIARTTNYLTQYIQPQTGLGNADAPTAFDT